MRQSTLRWPGCQEICEGQPTHGLHSHVIASIWSYDRIHESNGMGAITEELSQERVKWTIYGRNPRKSQKTEGIRSKTASKRLLDTAFINAQNCSCIQSTPCKSLVSRYDCWGAAPRNSERGFRVLDGVLRVCGSHCCWCAGLCTHVPRSGFACPNCPP